MYSSTDSENVNGNANTHFSVYKSLHGYNKVAPGDVHGPPVPNRIPSMAMQVVPQYHNQMGYHALTHNMAPEQMNTGHYSVRNAYPNYLSNCDTFQPRGCDKMLPEKGMVIINEADIVVNNGMTGMTGMTGMMEMTEEIVTENYGCSGKRPEKYHR